MTVDAPPHSRWMLQESVDQLAASHAVAAAAVATLARSAVGYGAAIPQPALGPRLAGRRGGPRTAWLGVTALCTALFLAWLSARLVRHLAFAPVTVAVLPGVLLAVALAVTAAHTASPGERASASGPVVLPWALFAVAVAGSVAWIALALSVTAGVAPWTALACGAALACGVAAGMLALARPVRPALVVVPRARPVPRRLRAQRRRAERRLRKHARQWNQAAQQYGVALAGASPAAGALARLLADDANLSLDGVEPYDILILTALHRYRPVPLAERLEYAVRRIEGGVPDQEPAE